MVRNEEKYQLATYYRKRGFTYSEIAKIVGVSKATISNWLAKKPFSKRIKKDNEIKSRRDNIKRISLLNKARSSQRKLLYAEALHSANTEYKHYKSLPLFTAGLMLYMAHGDTTDKSRIRLTSSNPDEHRLFIKFIKEFAGIENEQISCWLILQATMKEVVEIKAWSNQIKLPIPRFGKTQFLKPTSATKTLRNATGNTIIGNTVLKIKLIRWIKLATKQL